MVRIEVHGQRLARIRMDGESLGDWQIRGEGILGRRCLCGTVSTPKGHRQSVRTGDVNRDWIIGRIRELEASAQARVVTICGTTHIPYLSSSAAQPAFFNISQQLSIFSFIFFYWLRLGRSTQGTTYLQELVLWKSYVYSWRY